jgi:mono/diheme cytochrome c family protein
MRTEYYYQLSLIFLGVVATLFFGAFFYREVFPEYKIYQDIYWDLEKFRSGYTGKPPPPFTFGIKQIVFEKDDHGAPIIDRCTSCHVALQYNHFALTGPDSVWQKLDETIASLEKDGKQKEADRLKGLKTVEVGEHTYDVTKVLRMHPLMGKETRPFQFHPIDEYGCTSCHNGNGSGLTTEKAHGPVFDGQYEEEFVGPEPKFSELDSENDPAFARIFNHKPGHSLLFQTTPIYVGALMEAKCVQCHQAGKDDVLLKHYKRGEELYVSQACYACHRIDGLARGGVGPELTLEGMKYPWFIKESIVWPQADLKTSTMPNYRLDHVELEDLMTFLLAQNGRGRDRSETDYKKKITKWDAGEKTAIEKPINPAELHDLRYSMTIFATEGCAACHRLKGFESNVGYKSAKDKDEFETHYRESQWFKKLFPEEIIGSDIVKVLKEHSNEIDEHIIDNLRDGSILEEIESKYPHTIESFYANFAYAKRAGQNSVKWNDRVHRVLMMYIQEYGLGRLIGPRPNWSGIYRSDEWLIEHFRKPNRHTARSIMPALPFDDSKFYALTYMLDVLGKKNRDQVRQIWEKKGFDAELAYQIYCSQCHGEFLHGNGPVAEWIYPIPKNLRNADFLRNFTRENVIDSITHGVKGTPMPPWGEVAEDKPLADGIPVISGNEIKQIVDWIFSSLLGGEVIKNSKDVPKWQYSPADVLEEIRLEGGKLEQGPQPEFIELKEAKPSSASLNPLALTSQKSKSQEPRVDDVFTISPNKLGGLEKNSYYIQKKYYTKENLQAGQSFFELNCAVCHGIEADGTGYRAGSMFDAKPRMLTNLHWIDTRDDLRLLRSIKYGVQGTSMIPWGDQTTSLQRMQLVMFIRSLSISQEERDSLFNTLYRVFDTADQTIDTARVEEYGVLNKLNEQIKTLVQQQDALRIKVLEGNAKADEALNQYKDQLNLSAEVQFHQAKDQLLVDLKKLVKEEGSIYQILGIQLIAKSIFDNTDKIYLEVIESNSIHYEVKDGKLISTYDPEKEKKNEDLLNQIVTQLDQRIAENEKLKSALEAKVPSKEVTEELASKNALLSSLTKLKKEVHSASNQTKLLREKQIAIYKQYVEKEMPHGKI